jgi:integral membrane protein (TIGR01906 family)
MIFYKGFYLQEYDKTGVYDDLSQKLSITRPEAAMVAKNMTDNMFDFFHGTSELKYFTPDEKSHMKDVKFLMSEMNFVYYTSAIFFILIFVLLYLQFKKDALAFIDKLSKILYYGALACLVFLAAFFLICVFYFREFFITFHLIFFPQGNWAFDSSSLLLALFHEQFFFDITLRIFIIALIEAAVFFIIGLWLRKNVKLHKKYHG